MESPHALARRALDDVFAQAACVGLDADRLAKALVSQLLSRWAERADPASVRSAVEFELEHMGGDTDIEFMRP